MLLAGKVRAMEAPHPAPMEAVPPAGLPLGWERSTAPDGRMFFIDHNTQTTHWTPPAAPPASENKRLTSNGGMDADTARGDTAGLLALVQRPEIWARIATCLGGDELWRARRVSFDFRAACEGELARRSKKGRQCTALELRTKARVQLWLSSQPSAPDLGVKQLVASAPELPPLAVVTDEGVCEECTDEEEFFDCVSEAQEADEEQAAVQEAASLALAQQLHAKEVTATKVPTRFYHGTSLEAALAIQQHGFRVDLAGSNAGASLGAGVYIMARRAAALRGAHEGARRYAARAPRPAPARHRPPGRQQYHLSNLTTAGITPKGPKIKRKLMERLAAWARKRKSKAAAGITVLAYPALVVMRPILQGVGACCMGVGKCCRVLEPCLYCTGACLQVATCAG